MSLTILNCTLPQTLHSPHHIHRNHRICIGSRRQHSERNMQMALTTIENTSTDLGIERGQILRIARRRIIDHIRPSSLLLSRTHSPCQAIRPSCRLSSRRHEQC
ncbi:hypothetical protein BLNAU_2469 [Blattamonas nauphoetae]|uniref:Uncharacterized protein n=1 Tax=Blattamonas nauphoetae TaxID=2049346 RepID=A0ABQ9YFT9_9EUKA|nr:hypothetical protein BLNAU_19282 [Blattamonas nauphoetae]KAK2962636.1 hypothetical protein BLNAU_2469 [Blattamonas nauphoetae]